MRYSLILVVICTIFSSTICLAAPNVSVGVGEGYGILLKNNEANPGAVNTRLHVIIGQKLNEKISLSLLVGILTDNTIFKPMPRAAIIIGTPVAGRIGIIAAALYQLNYGYGGHINTHSLSVGVAPTYKMSDNVSGSIFFSGGKTLDSTWFIAFQPGITYGF